MFESVPPYSLERTNYHKTKKLTKYLNVPYYINEDFYERAKERNFV